MTRLWMVERSYDDRNLVTLVYATTDGERMQRKELSAELLAKRGPTTAAIEIDESETEETPEENVDRYAEEASRVADRNDPDDEI